MKNDNEQILNSVIEITRQRDRDSLEFSLVATLAELIPLKSIAFYRCVSEISEQALERVVCLDMEKNDQGDLKYLWGSNTEVIIAEGQYLDCLRTKDAVSSVSTLRHRLIIPVFTGDSIIGLLDLYSDIPLDAHDRLIHGLVRICENFFYILKEGEHDPLTGLLNRRTFDSRLDRMLEAQAVNNQFDTAIVQNNHRAAQSDDALAWLVVVDIDHFKRINDTFGHMYGDEVLLLLAQIMQKSFRHGDMLFRFGGEEFVVVLSPCSPEDVDQAVERFRKTVQKYSFPQIEQVTVSMGYAAIRPHDFPATILDQADKALYYAKTHGRNCVCSYAQLVESGKLSEHVVKNDVELF